MNADRKQQCPGTFAGRGNGRLKGLICGKWLGHAGDHGQWTRDTEREGQYFCWPQQIDWYQPPMECTAVVRDTIGAGRIVAQCVKSLGHDDPHQSAMGLVW